MPSQYMPSVFPNMLNFLIVTFTTNYAAKETNSTHNQASQRCAMIEVSLVPSR